MNKGIYVVVYPSTSKFAEAEAINPTYDNSQRIVCPMCQQFLSGSKWVEKKMIKLNKRNIPDFLYLHGGSDLPFIISEKAYNVLTENHIEGIIDAELIDTILLKGEVLNKAFYQIRLERGMYSIDHIRSKIVYGREHPEKKCRLCNPLGRTKDFIAGLYFTYDSYFDKDIFNTYEMGSTVFLSERFIKICKDNNLTGLCYENINEYNSAEGIYSKDEILKMIPQTKPDF